MDFYSYWQATLRQDAAAMRPYFNEAAVINWPNTNEQFTPAEFIRANCEYPGRWGGAVERIEQLGSLTVTVTRVYGLDGEPSFHVVSFFELEDGRISRLDEYWGDDGSAPQWRRDKMLGRPICG